MSYVKKNNPIDAMETPFAKRLRALMDNENNISPLHKNVSQTELAAFVGISRQAVNAYTLGVSVPDINKLGKIADFFTVSCEYLLGRTDAMNYEYAGVVEQLGLSQFTIERIKQFKDLGFSEILSELMFNSNFISALHQMNRLLHLNLGDGFHAIVSKSDFDKLNNGEKCQAEFLSSGVIKNIFSSKAKRDIEAAIDETLISLEEKGNISSEEVLKTSFTFPEGEND